MHVIYLDLHDGPLTRVLLHSVVWPNASQLLAGKVMSPRTRTMVVGMRSDTGRKMASEDSTVVY